MVSKSLCNSQNQESPLIFKESKSTSSKSETKSMLITQVKSNLSDSLGNIDEKEESKHEYGDFM